MSTGPERMWYGLPMIDLESYLTLRTRVTALEETLGFIEDSANSLRRRVGQLEAQLDAEVSRETIE